MFINSGFISRSWSSDGPSNEAQPLQANADNWVLVLACGQSLAGDFLKGLASS